MIDSNGLFRIAPAGPVGAYRTFEVAAPLGTHWREGTCEEVDCEAYRLGWVTKIDIGTELGRQQAMYIIDHSGRRFVPERIGETLVEFTFEPGQKCFARHQVPLERDPLLIVRDGDWRGNPTGQRRLLSNVDDWVGEFQENQERIAREA